MHRNKMHRYSITLSARASSAVRFPLRKAFRSALLWVALERKQRRAGVLEGWRVLRANLDLAGTSADVEGFLPCRAILGGRHRSQGAVAAAGDHVEPRRVIKVMGPTHADGTCTNLLYRIDRWGTAARDNLEHTLPGGTAAATRYRPRSAHTH
jgi:hypothetical protein